MKILITDESLVVFMILLLIMRSGVAKLEFLGYLAPVAFVFALGALSQVGALKKEVDQLKREIENLKNSN